MRPQPTTDGPQARVVALARRQYGLVTREQMLAEGLHARRIGRWLHDQRLHRVHAGVYAVGQPAMTREARWLAAVLASGEGALLSHRSAASLWRIRDGEGPHPDVVVPIGRRPRHPGVALHRARLTDADRAVRFRVPVTSPARTLAELAHVLDDRELVRAVREAQVLRLFDLAATREVLTRRRSRALRAVIADLVLAETYIEDDLLRLCDRHRIPRPRTQRQSPGGRVDFLWPEHGVVVEADGWEAHGTRDAFQRDRAATNTLQLAGYLVLRFTHADILRRPRRTAGQIRAALAVAPTGRRRTPPS